MKKTTRNQILQKQEEADSSEENSQISQSLKRSKKIVAPKITNRQHLPMLAYDYRKKADKVVYPCFVQPKLDGVRALFYNGKFYSRNGNQFYDLEHIKEELVNCNMVLDGELYTGEIKFEELVGLVKKQTKTDEDKKKSEKIKYIVYDIISDDTFSSRNYHLNNFFEQKFYLHTQPLITEECKKHEEIKTFHDKYVNLGYEGLIIRNKKGKYQEKNRSNDLLKYKEFEEDEFEIVDFKCGTGQDANAVIWICKTKEGKIFKARPEGTLEERRKQYRQGKSNIGKLLTVKYQNLSKDGIPRFPVGITIRDYE
jgi:DNA ligase-1